MLRKGFYLYEYMDSWQRFNETSVPDKKGFYNILNIENTTDTDSKHAKNVWREF